MQDRYVGDVGDFANNGLLRWLCGKPELDKTHKDSPAGKLKLGVVWYLNEPTKSQLKNGDGKRINYLCTSLICGPENRRDYRKCDPFLYDILKDIVERGNRNVEAVQEGEVLPKDTAYYKALLTLQIDRTEWLRRALQKTEGAEIIFVNPDKGIASEKLRTKHSREHVYMWELECLAKAEKGKSLVIYQHLGRNGSHEAQVQKRLELLRSKFPGAYFRALRHQYQGIGRAYFIVAQAGDHQSIIEKRLKCFLEGPWGQHFKEPPA